MDLQWLAANEIEIVHDALVEEFALDESPIFPPGVRDRNLLLSAVDRQAIGLGSVLKYPDAIGSASTLTYGLCNNHPFHNGNKRTALVCMLVHLDRNKLCLWQTSSDELYGFIKQVASHQLPVGSGPRPRSKANSSSRDPDGEIGAMSSWIGARAQKITRGERRLTYRDLKRLLNEHHFELDNPENNKIDIFELREVRSGLWRRPGLQRVRIGWMSWPGESRDVSLNEIKAVRRLCKLTEEHGVDSSAFYLERPMIDSFINRYRRILVRLANT